jgi:hypothetical protein
MIWASLRGTRLRESPTMSRTRERRSPGPSQCSCTISGPARSISESIANITITTSSAQPMTGMTSGMRSMGLTTYAAASPRLILALRGTLGSLRSRPTSLMMFGIIKTASVTSWRPWMLLPSGGRTSSGLTRLGSSLVTRSRFSAARSIPGHDGRHRRQCHLSPR